MTWRNAAVWIVVSQALAAASGENVDPSPLVDGVGSVWMEGSPGPIMASSPDLIPVVTGDDDTSFPSVVVVAAGHGRGRVVACGQGSCFKNGVIDQYDNRQFASNVLGWLDKTAKRRILITQGHREWYGGDNFSTLTAALQRKGYTCTRSSAQLGAGLLTNTSVVIVGDAWGAFTPGEISALENFVDTGGGLLLLGLGWSWEPYNPGTTLDDYPMNVIGKHYGIRWIDGSITDPTNAKDGSPIFHTFYPNTGIQSIYQAFDTIDEVFSTHSAGLADLVQHDSSTSEDVIRSLLLIRSVTSDRGSAYAQRQDIYDFYARILTTYPQYFDKSVVYDSKTQNAMAWIRECVHRSLEDALPLTPQRKAEIADLLGLTGRYLDIWNEFSVLVQDNTSLNSRQRDFIYNCLRLVPKGLHNLRSISVRDNIGADTTPAIPLSGLEESVNIFGFDIGAYRENSFPDDVSSGVVDIFCSAMAHELNHVVDANYVGSRPALKQRRDALLAAAGRNPMNYLRSMIPAGFFADTPQEFFASMSNEWFTDSAKTIELGIVRLKNGIRHPIEQALFFADVYSMGGNKTYFYAIDLQGNVTRRDVEVVRNQRKDIVALQTAQLRYEFTWTSQGTVADAKITPRSSAETPTAVESFEDGFSALDWTFDGESPWTVSSSTQHWGSRSAQAGAIGADAQTSLSITRNCQAGQIRFWCKVSCESNWDFLSFLIDGQSKGEWSGEQEWQELAFSVSPGQRTFAWTYSKDGSGSGGQDTAWIDDITFPAQ
ncbi:MAG: hypothetical protein ABFE01_29150 [Phycisphaerales bacterium]